MKPHIELYGHDTCVYCLRAKNLLAAQGYEAEYLNIRASDDAMRDFLARTNGARTVPQILINGKLIGGFEELRALIASGEFQQIVGGE